MIVLAVALLLGLAGVARQFGGAQPPSGSVDAEGKSAASLEPVRVYVHANGAVPGTGSPQVLAREDVKLEAGQEVLAQKRLYSSRGKLLAFRHLKPNMSVYEVAANRHFLWPPSASQSVEVFPPAKGRKRHVVKLEPLLDSPKVFYVHDFLSDQEADFLVERAQASDNPYKIRRSTTGHKSWTQEEPAENENSERTSENAFDIDSPVARAVKRRAFSLLRIKKYVESMADGIQILRYKQKQAYIAHHDYFAVGTSPDHNWDPSTGGTNRMATIFLYLSNVTAGGQTVFPRVDPNGAVPNVAKPTEAEELFKPDTWQHSMVDTCYSKFAVPPRKGDAILFYSQLPDGTLDDNSIHGGCPVLDGTKWAANLWVWNGCRYGEC